MIINNNINKLPNDKNFSPTSAKFSRRKWEMSGKLAGNISPNTFNANYINKMHNVKNFIENISLHLVAALLSFASGRVPIWRWYPGTKPCGEIKPKNQRAADAKYSRNKREISAKK